jgi:peptidoglycan/LPS O-acetylase OafA/YrhL
MRIAQLDGLRAFAVAGVLISHFPPTTHLDWLFSALPWGLLGVRLFFVLSGFLITQILLERQCAVQLGIQTYTNAVTSFYGRRCLRIFPIFYLTILVAYLLDVGQIREMAKWHILYLSNFEPAVFYNFPSRDLGLRDPTSAHFWSLAVEEQFYLIWPTVLLLSNAKQLMKIVLSAIIMAVVWRALWLLFVPAIPSMSVLACLDSLGMGALLAMSRQKGPLAPVWIGKTALAASVLILTACCVGLKLGILWRPCMVLIDISASIVFAFLIFWAMQDRQSIFGKILAFRPLVYIGKISYGIYVYHAFMTPLMIWSWTEFNFPPIPPHSILQPLVTTLMTIIVASISWYLIELPIGRLKRLIPRGPSEMARIIGR